MSIERKPDVGVELKQDERELRFMTPKAIVYTLIFMVITVLIMRSEAINQISVLGGTTLPSPFPFLIVFLLALISNYASKKKILFLSLTRAELAIIYAVTGFMVMLDRGNFFAPLLQNLTFGHYQYLVNPRALAPIIEPVAEWAFVTSEDALFDFWIGGVSVPWGEWILPIIVWTLLFGSFAYLFSFLGQVFYNRWSKIERLSFALVVPTVAIANIGEGYEEKGYDFRSKLFLLGGIIPLIIWLPTTLNRYFPIIPQVTPELDFAKVFTQEPFNPGLTYWPGFVLRFWPFAIGLGYIIPSDVSLSIWLFYFIQRALGLVFYYAGRMDQTSPFIGGVGRGAMLGLAAVVVWYSRNSIKEFFKAAVSSRDVDSEHMSTRLPVILAIIALVYIVFVTTYILPINWWFIPVFLIILASVALTFARARAESGVPYANTELTTVANTIHHWFGGVDRIGRHNTVWINFLTRHSMWCFVTTTAWSMETQKLGEVTNAKDRNYTPIIITIGFIVALLLMFIVLLPVCYSEGATLVLGTSYGNHTFNSLPSGTVVDINFTVYAIIGFVASIAFGILRTAFFWWPVSAIGFAMAFDNSLSFRFPGSFLLAWIIKTLVTRYGGRQSYQKLLPFFIGMVVFDTILKGISAVLVLFEGIL